MEQIKREKMQSLKRAFAYAMLFTVFIIIISSLLTIWGCYALQKWIMPDKNQAYLHMSTTYTDGSQRASSLLVTFGEKGNIPLIEAEGKLSPGIEKISNYSIEKIENSYDSLTPKRKAAYSLLTAAMVGLPAIYSVTGVLLCALWFYRKKLEKPIQILSDATENIVKEDLDFTVTYDGDDEMAGLCDSFEMMRQTLYNNNQKLWNMLEERRILQASVAHDLRNPISIIQGYTEYLQQSMLQGKLTEEKMRRTADNLSTASKRLEQYTDSIQDIQSLEDIEINPKISMLPQTLMEMAEDFHHMAEQQSIVLHVHVDIPSCTAMIDQQVLYRILENLFSNALRFAMKRIDLTFTLKDSKLLISIEDDGEGFPEKILRNQALYVLSPSSSDRHMSMGLIISRILSKKHGGVLRLSNEPGGARAELEIFI